MTIQLDKTPDTSDSKLVRELHSFIVAHNVLKEGTQVKTGCITKRLYDYLNKVRTLAHSTTLVDAPLKHHKLGLQETASGYGMRLTTRYKLKVGTKEYRVYSTCISNVSTEYVIIQKQKFLVDLQDYDDQQATLLDKDKSYSKES